MVTYLSFIFCAM